MTRADIKEGDMVELDCPQLLNNTRRGTVIKGKVKCVFDALNADGSEGNLEIDLITDIGWIRYKPNIDGGTIKILK